MKWCADFQGQGAFSSLFFGQSHCMLNRDRLPAQNYLAGSVIVGDFTDPLRTRNFSDFRNFIKAKTKNLKEDADDVEEALSAAVEIAARAWNAKVWRAVGGG